LVRRWSSQALVSVVCWQRLSRRLELARHFGAHATIDVDKDDPVACVHALTNGGIAA
jgi:threonine dehydrogenase-like Zn-dependent dehydrogenase